jgi:hypothetical protein
MTADALKKITTDALDKLAARLDEGHSDQLTALLKNRRSGFMSSPRRGEVMSEGITEEHSSQGERSVSIGTCERCRKPFKGRTHKRFCSDRCRTARSREQRALARDSRVEQIRALVDQLSRVQGQ